MPAMSYSVIRGLGWTDPLQLINEPMVPASRQLKPAYLAAKLQPPNFPIKARTQIATVNPQIVPNN
jgi:hypothetical protein